MTATRSPVERLMRPQSIAIVGVSPEASSLGYLSLRNLRAFGFGGDIRLVSRSNATVDELACVPTIDDLPGAIDAAILALPRAAIVDAIEACARRGIGAAIVFAAGFAEMNDDGCRDQERLTSVARATGMAVAGPNCLGLVNYVDRVPFLMGPMRPSALHDRAATTILAQSGGMMATMNGTFAARGIDVAYAISTGNEAVTGIEDYLEFVLADGRRGPVALFLETIRFPERFLTLARQARELDRPLVLYHTGRSAAARASAQSHTGALVGDFATMQALVSAAGVVCVETPDELFETAAILTRFPERTPGALGFITESGAYKGFAIDFCERLDVPFATLAPATIEALESALPPFAHASNPIDLTAHVIRDGALYTTAAKAFVADPSVGAIVACVMTGAASLHNLARSEFLATLQASGKPSTIAFLGQTELPPTLTETVHADGYPISRSGEAAMRAMRYVLERGNIRPAPTHDASLELQALPPFPAGAMTEADGKALLRAAGISVPPGALAATLAQALATASAIGYPVVLKAQSAHLLHKSEAGGVFVGIGDEAALRDAWRTVEERVRECRPDVVLAGMLVERMVPGGVELVVGAKRDPDWGTVLLVGVGGIWIESLGDVALLPPDASRATIVTALRGLKAAALLQGKRGSEPVDINAVADALQRLAAIMRAESRILELEINPLVATRNGVTALDALVSFA